MALEDRAVEVSLAGERRTRRFFVVTSASLLVLVLVGFAPSFFLKFVFDDPGQLVHAAQQVQNVETTGAPAESRLPLQVVAHGVFATAWLVLFFIQALLIASRRTALHQRIGVTGLVIGAGVAASGFAVVLLAVPRLVRLAEPVEPASVIAEALPGFAGDLGTMIAFTVAVGLAGYLRHTPESHKQLMLLASMTLVVPALFRIWALSGVEGALELWFPLSENVLAIAIIGGYWIVRRRAPRALLGGFVAWLVLYGLLTGLGSAQAIQMLVLDWVT